MYPALLPFFDPAWISQAKTLARAHILFLFFGYSPLCKICMRLLSAVQLRMLSEHRTLQCRGGSRNVYHHPREFMSVTTRMLLATPFSSTRLLFILSPTSLPLQYQGYTAPSPVSLSVGTLLYCLKNLTSSTCRPRSTASAHASHSMRYPAASSLSRKNRTRLQGGRARRLATSSLRRSVRFHLLRYFELPPTFRHFSVYRIKLPLSTLYYSSTVLPLLFI